jgi:transposase
MTMDGQAKRFRVWDARQGRQEIVSPETVLPEDDMVFFLLETIPGLDLSAFYAYYSTDGRGQPPFAVPMMVTLLVYAYSVGVFSSRKIAAACERNLAFMAIVADERPDFRTISEFRKHHRAAMRPLFLHVLRLAGEVGMVKLGNLSTDGTKIEANASRHKAMSYGYMTKELTRLENEIAQLLNQADRVDDEQDAALGSRRGDELPDELKRREDRLVKIREAKERLEAEARERAAEEQRQRDAAEAERQAAGKKRRGKEPAPVKVTPEDKAQTNFTDPEAKIMKRSNKGFDYCYNTQAVVDSEHQIIVAAEVCTAANDKQQAVPLAQAAVKNLVAAGIERPRDDQGRPLPIPNTADNGYYSEDNVRGVEAAGLDPYFAVGRQKHHASATAASAADATPAPTIAASAADSAPASATAAPAGDPTPAPASNPAASVADEHPKETMAKKLRTLRGRVLYAARKHIVEPVFGQIKQVRGFRKFLLRGLELVSAEWQLICLTHNLLKIWRHVWSVP